MVSFPINKMVTQRIHVTFLHSNEQDCQASQLQTEKDYFTTEPLSREPVSTVKVLFNPGLFEAKCLQMSKIVLNCFEI